MSDSNSFSSLLALVDSHLSKTNMQASYPEDVENRNSRLPLPSLSGDIRGTSETLSEASLAQPSCQRLTFPTLSLTDSPIQKVLAKQVTNMLKAKERKKQEEELTQSENNRQNIENKLKKLEIDDEKECIIDLVKVVKETKNLKISEKSSQKKVALSSSSSIESLFESKFIDCDEEPENLKIPEPLLPCTTDMSYILTQKIRKGKCSAFGKVLTSRLKPVAAPYFFQKIHSKINHFDFMTKSPCDLINEKLRKPQVSNSRMFDIISIFPALGT